MTATAGSWKAPETVARPGPDIVRLPTPLTVVAITAVAAVLMSSVPPPDNVRVLVDGMEIGPRRVPPLMTYSEAEKAPVPAMLKTPFWTVILPEFVREPALRLPPAFTTPEAMMPPVTVVVAALVKEPTEVMEAAVAVPARSMTEPESGPVRSSEPVEVMAPVAARLAAAMAPPVFATAPVTERVLPGSRSNWPAELSVRFLVVVSGAFVTGPASVVVPSWKSLAPAPSMAPPIATVVEVVAASEPLTARLLFTLTVTLLKLALPESATPTPATTRSPLPPIWLATMPSVLVSVNVVPGAKVRTPSPRVPPLARRRVPSATLMPPVKANGSSIVRMPAPVLLKPESAAMAWISATWLALTSVGTLMVARALVGT